jgi:iron complex transport system permease protein
MKPWITWLALLAGCLLTLAAGIALGNSSLAVSDVFQIVGRRFFSRAELDFSDSTVKIVWLLRMPRVLLAFLVGGGLSIIGVAMQTLVRNPLAEPYILGISSGASAGASLFFLGFLPPVLSLALTLPLTAFLGGLITLLLVFAVARLQGQVEITRLVLAGVAMAALMGALPPRDAHFV